MLLSSSSDRLGLAESKIGPRAVLLGEAARSLLQRRSQQRKGRSPFVFPGPVDPRKPRMSIPQVWRRIRAEAGLADDVRLHDLRHIRLACRNARRNLDDGWAAARPSQHGHD